VKRIDYPDGERVDYGYDLGGNLKSVEGEKNGQITKYVDSISYDEYEQRIREVNGNGVVTNYSYDPKTRRLDNLVNNSTQNNMVLQDNVYKYDNVGNIINIQDNGLNTRGQNYEYDEINRLISSDGSWTDNNNNTLNYKNGFEYSPSGKMMRKNMDSRRIDNKQGIYNVIYENAYSYNNQNNPYGASSIKDIMTGSIDNYEWDKKGNMIYQNNESTGRERALCWTEDNRLQGYRETRGQSGYYNYRAGGERNIKYVGETVTITQNGKTYYRPVLNQPTLYASELITINERGYTKHYYEEGKRICSKIGGGFGGVEAREVLDNRVKLLNGSYLELPGEKREGIRRSFECMEEEVELENEGALRSIMEIEMGRNDAEPAFYYQSDHLGSASYVTDNSGAVTQTLNYLPYGEDWVDLQNFNVMPASYNLGVYKFNGKEKDQESGYNYYGARYYDSEKISWISVDPMSDKYPNLSPYVYCANNPVILVDPNGEEIGWVLNSRGGIDYDSRVKNKFDAVKYYGKKAKYLGESGYSYIGVNGTHVTLGKNGVQTNVKNKKVTQNKALDMAKNNKVLLNNNVNIGISALDIVLENSRNKKIKAIGKSIGVTSDIINTTDALYKYSNSEPGFKRNYEICKTIIPVIVGRTVGPIEGLGTEVTIDVFDKCLNFATKIHSDIENWGNNLPNQIIESNH